MHSEDEPFDFFHSKPKYPVLNEEQINAYSDAFKDLIRRGCLLEHTWRLYLMEREQPEDSVGPYSVLGLDLTKHGALRLVIRHEGVAVLEVKWAVGAEEPEIFESKDKTAYGAHPIPTIAKYLSEDDVLAYQLSPMEAAVLWLRLSERQERIQEVWMGLVNQWTQEGYAHHERWSVGTLFDLEGNLKRPIFNSTGKSIGAIVYTAYGRDYRLFKQEGFDEPPLRSK